MSAAPAADARSVSVDHVDAGLRVDDHSLCCLHRSYIYIYSFIVYFQGEMALSFHCGKEPRRRPWSPLSLRLISGWRCAGRVGPTKLDKASHKCEKTSPHLNFNTSMR